MGNGKITKELKNLGLKINGTEPTGETVSEVINDMANDYTSLKVMQRSKIIDSILHFKYDSDVLTKIIPTCRVDNYDKEIHPQVGVNQKLKIYLYETEIESDTTNVIPITTFSDGIRIGGVFVEENIKDTKVNFKTIDFTNEKNGKTYKYQIAIENILHTNEDGSSYYYNIYSNEMIYTFPTTD